MAEETSKIDSSDSEPSTASTAEIDELTTLHERAIAMLSYAGFLAVIPFYLKKESKFCRFHGKQGMLLAILFFLAQIVGVIDLFHDLMLVIQFAVFIRMGFAALSGRWHKAPWIYDTACLLEKSLTLKTKEEEGEEDKLKPEQVKAENI